MSSLTRSVQFKARDGKEEKKKKERKKNANLIPHGRNCM
jgi:hypothetical protein